LTRENKPLGSSNENESLVDAFLTTTDEFLTLLKNPVKTSQADQLRPAKTNTDQPDQLKPA